MKILKSALIWLREKPSFVGRLKVVSDVEERCPFEGVPESADLRIPRNESCEPVVCDTN